MSMIKTIYRNAIDPSVAELYGKALALVNEVSYTRYDKLDDATIPQLVAALFVSIERREAFRMEERDAIVAWLRETSDIFHDEISVSRKRDTSELLHHAQSCSRAAKAIEAGEHLK